MLKDRGYGKYIVLYSILAFYNYSYGKTPSFGNNGFHQELVEYYTIYFILLLCVFRKSSLMLNVSAALIKLFFIEVARQN